jgi:HK97 gp10 family phage protein
MIADTSGLDALAKELNKKAATAKMDVAKVVSEAVDRVFDAASADVPHGATEELSGSLRKRKTGAWGEVYSTARHSVFNEYGTYKMAARPFLYPALDANEDWFLRALGLAVEL